MKAENMTGRGGKEIANQFIVTDDNQNIFFQSYQSIIVKIDNENGGITYLDKNKYDYSTTTIKYRNAFLMETSKEIERKIKEGKYILTDLN